MGIGCDGCCMQYKIVLHKVFETIPLGTDVLMQEYFFHVKSVFHLLFH